MPERSYQDVKVNSSAGQIEISDVKSDRVSARTLTGEVDLKHVTAKNVEGSTKAGEVNFKKSNRESDCKNDQWGNKYSRS